MVTGEPGADGPYVQRPAGEVSRQGAEHAPIQLVRMAAVLVQDPLRNRHLVTLHLAKVLQLISAVFVFRCYNTSLVDYCSVHYVLKRSSNNYLPFFHF